MLLKSRGLKGEIKNLSRQVSIELTKNAKKHLEKVFYIADFVFFDVERDCWIVWDSKGMPTDAYKIKRKWLLDTYKGFVFIEANKREKKEFIPNGEILLEFKAKEREC